MNKVARLITTLDCNRNCEYCCNKQEGMIEQARRINDLSMLNGYDVVCITGGEPMLDPIRTKDFIRAIKLYYSKAKIYLYTALYDRYIRKIIPLIDGIHYSIHRNLRPSDISRFEEFQNYIFDCSDDKLFRLYIESGVDLAVPIIPCLWKRIEVKPWMVNCPLPENEDLFLWIE
jgi:hypothetical protein